MWVYVNTMWVWNIFCIARVERWEECRCRTQWRHEQSALWGFEGTWCSLLRRRSNILLSPHRYLSRDRLQALSSFCILKVYLWDVNSNRQKSSTAWRACQAPGPHPSPSVTEVEVQGLRAGKSSTWHCKVLRAFLLIQEVNLDVFAVLCMTSSGQNLNLWELCYDVLSKSVCIFWRPYSSLESPQFNDICRQTNKQTFPLFLLSVSVYAVSLYRENNLAWILTSRE